MATYSVRKTTAGPTVVALSRCRADRQTDPEFLRSSAHGVRDNGVDLNTTVVAPVPSANVTAVTPTNPGLLRTARTA